MDRADFRQKFTIPRLLQVKIFAVAKRAILRALLWLAAFCVI
jgi:hypothetical protein